MKVLGIIPARGGSKGIKNKNMQLLNGKPLVWHAAETALKSAVLDRIVLNTNDDTIIEAMQSHAKIDIPFKRPEHLATDTSLISDTIAHLLEWLETNENYIPDAFMLLEPTCPLRTVEDLQEAIKLYKSAGKHTLISVSEPQQHPSNMICANENGYDYCLQRNVNARGRQDFHPTWFINGAVYITATDYFKRSKKVYDLNSCALYVMPSERAFDINTPFDLALVRAHMHSMLEEESYA